LVISQALIFIAPFALDHPALSQNQVDTAVDQAADALVDGLDWLKHSPGGIKLNPQMTSFLTKLCYHHVRIWQSYAKLILTRLIEHKFYILALGKISISAFTSFQVMIV